MGEHVVVYPNATSKTIMMVNPIIKQMVAKSTFPARCDSGMSSSTTTKIIAPAAKLSAYGSIVAEWVTAAAPMAAAIGSITAES